MPVSVRVGGTWRAATNVFTRVGGTWRTASDMPVRVGGVWRTGVLIQGAYDSIATFTGNGTASSYTFSSIPQTYKHLQVRVSGLAAANQGNLIMRLNGVTANASYATHQLWGEGTTATAQGSANAGAAFIGNLSSSMHTTFPTVAIIDIADYNSTAKNKTVRAVSGQDRNAQNGDIILQSALFLSTNAITSVEITIDSGTNFATGTSIALYGIKG